jgi:hypothetical protein
MTDTERKFMVAKREAAYAAYVKADKEAKHADALRNALCDAWLEWCKFGDDIEREEARENANHVAESDCPTTPLREMAQDEE